MTSSPRLVGRYVLGESFAAGGMATVHLGLLSGPTGFRRVVAIKRMHPSLAQEPQARATFLDEARLTSRLHHPNVVPTLDVVEDANELFLVLEYVDGESLDRLLTVAAAGHQPVPPRIAAAILVGTLRGLHAAHEAVGEDRRPLELVHRDLSPPNVMVDLHGVARVLDFGIARARGRLQATREGQLKGKLSYLSPEQVHGDASRRSDLFAAGAMLFEALTGRRLFDAPTEAALLSQVLLCRVPRLKDFGVDAPALQDVLDKALQREPADRYATAAEMADALERFGIATPAEVAAWVTQLAGAALGERRQRIEKLEHAAASALTPAPPTSAVTSPAPSRSPSRAPFAVVLVLAVAGLAWFAGRERPVAAVVVPAIDAGRPTLVAPAVPDAGVAVVAEPSVDAGAAEVATPDAGKPVTGTTVRKPKNPPATDPCDPPYEIDRGGVKRYKVQCLK